MFEAVLKELQLEFKELKEAERISRVVLLEELIEVCIGWNGTTRKEFTVCGVTFRCGVTTDGFLFIERPHYADALTVYPISSGKDLLKFEKNLKAFLKAVNADEC